MKQDVRPQPKRSANVPLFREAFIKRVLQLLKLGYEMLTPERFATAQEEVITGELIRAIDDVLDNPPSAISEWADSFWAQEDRRVQKRGRRGKRRLRIDISIHSSEFHPRARFHFEAKRLGGRNSVRKYLGPDGLGAYLSGAYAKAESDAGMLGYVQSEDERRWAMELERQLSADSRQYACTSNPTLEAASLAEGLNFTYLSIHSRAAPMTPICIYHLLILFR
jgi:hypothetical protein